MLCENNVVGQTIRAIRKSKGISQEVLSGFAGIARTHLTMIECGTKQANFSTICKIALAFDMKPSELVRKMEEVEESAQNQQSRA
ncbi:MAG: helix-turn-helix domain-containing protein [Hominenteromicrobium sp.]